VQKNSSPSCKWLVENGALERRAYSERPPRHEYRLTAKGLELCDVDVEPGPGAPAPVS
jgi:DNA-binding HxlR family transcriptional regulator